MDILHDSNTDSAKLRTMTETELHLLVAADSLLIRAGLAALLEERGCLVLAQVDGGGLHRAVEGVQPDMLVIDMGRDEGAMRGELSRLEGDLPILTLVAHAEADEMRRLLDVLAGFRHYGLLLRDSEPGMIVAALRALDGGLVVIDPNLSELLKEPARPQPSDEAAALTPREKEVLQWLAQGLTNKAIALALGVTEHTVKFHVNAIMGKLDAQSRTEAVVRATQLGLIVL